MVVKADKLTVDQQAVIIACSSQPMQDIGFIPGESIKILARMPLGGPVAVRVGVSTFAVRDEELATVEIRIEE